MILQGENEEEKDFLNGEFEIWHFYVCTKIRINNQWRNKVIMSFALDFLFILKIKSDIVATSKQADLMENKLEWDNSRYFIPH